MLIKLAQHGISGMASDCVDGPALLPVRHREVVLRCGHRFKRCHLPRMIDSSEVGGVRSTLHIASCDIDLVLRVAKSRGLKNSEVEGVSVDLLLLDAEDMDFVCVALQVEEVL